MKKQVLFLLALVVAFSTIPAQAAETKKPKSTWCIVKNSAKIVAGVCLTFGGLKGFVGGVTTDMEDVRRHIQNGLQETRPDRINELQAAGIPDGEVERLSNQIDADSLEHVMDTAYFAKNLLIGFGGGFTLGGIALLYSGIKGFIEDEEESIAK